MCKSIDLKSVIIGGLTVALVVCALGVVPNARPDQFGRFELAASTNVGFVLDTATGQVWTLQTGFSNETAVFSPHTTEEFWDQKLYDDTRVEPNWP